MVQLQNAHLCTNNDAFIDNIFSSDNKSLDSTQFSWTVLYPTQRPGARCSKAAPQPNRASVFHSRFCVLLFVCFMFAPVNKELMWLGKNFKFWFPVLNPHKTWKSPLVKTCFKTKRLPELLVHWCRLFQRCPLGRPFPLLLWNEVQ